MKRELKGLMSMKEVSRYIGKSTQTLALWDKQSDALEAAGNDRLIPKPQRLGPNESRYWTEEQVKKIFTFSMTLQYGGLEGYSRKRNKEKEPE